MPPKNPIDLQNVVRAFGPLWWLLGRNKYTWKKNPNLNSASTFQFSKMEFSRPGALIEEVENPLLILFENKTIFGFR